MKTHDISLPGSRRPRWPDRCVCCEKEHPGHKAKIGVTGASSSLGWAKQGTLVSTAASLGGSGNIRVKLEVPCCESCAPALERRHCWRTVLLYVTGILGAAASVAVMMVCMIAGLHGALTGILSIGALLGTLALPIAYDFLRPPPFTITPCSGRITYEFLSARCAEEFARANDTAIHSTPTA